MKRRRLDESSHQLHSHPFEAYWWGSWQPVERLRIKDGIITMHVTDGEKVMEENIPMPNLRLRSRKATVSDCSCLLRPGIDVCVLSTPDMGTSDKKKSSSSVWADARIRSIERKPHDSGCSCKFYISFYVMDNPVVSPKRKINKEISMVQLGHVSILQKLESKPCEDQHYRWSTSEDSASLQKFKLFTGKFCSDITWLLVASIAKQTAFDVKSIQNRIVYEIYDDDIDKTAAQYGKCSHFVNFKLDNGISSSIIVPFVPDNLETNTSQEMQTAGPLCLLSDFNELRRSKRRNIKPQRFLACDLTEDDIDMSRLGADKLYRWEYEEEDDELPLALSIQADHEYQRHVETDKRAHPFKQNAHQQFLLCGSEEKSTVPKRVGQLQMREKRESHQSGLAIVPLSLTSEGNSVLFEQDALEDESYEDQPGDIGELFSQYINGKGSTGGYRRKTSASNSTKGEGRWRGHFPSKRFQGGRIYKKNISYKKFVEGAHIFKGPGGGGSSRRIHKRNPYCTRSEWESIYDLKPSGRKSLSAKACRELITRCMENIDASINLEQPQILDQWKEFQSGNLPNQKHTEEKPNVKCEEEVSEVDLLWKEMELALASLYFLDDNQNPPVFSTERNMPSNNDGNLCQHDYRLNEQIGIVCRLCGFVSTEIKDVSPQLWSSTNSTLNKEQKNEEDSVHQPELHESLNQFHVPASTNTPSSEGEVEDNVWALIPELRSKLRIHQKKAFEFLWTNIAGSLVPGLMEAEKKKRGGCVISHTPGAGKTLLIITFLVSYLKLFPGSRPLVLAPKTTLYTWYKEIIKWKIPVPVYQIHGGQTYKGEVLRQRLRLNPGLPRNQDVMHVLDCLEKMQKWLSHPSILLMGYTSFLTLTREGSIYAHRKYMAQVLKQCPGILILDEGHNPRSTKSRLRKGLMKVDTNLRVLLSGTLFQNNFGEYFNTLCLARPGFVNEVLKELDPKYKRKKNAAQNRFSTENRARKMFIDKISRRIDSSVPEERLESLNLLKNLTGGFIDVYEGGSTDNLPGLQCYTLMMKSTSLQQEILVKLQNQRPVYKGFPLELELLITLGAIHPWLIRTTQCSNQYFKPEELEDLERTKFDVKYGSKVRFVMSLIPKCVFRKEKVLIFCHNIAPINLFLDLFASIFRWRKGKEVLVLQGDIELFERGRVMDKFEEPGGPSKVMLASITACAEGISLTAASRVILLDSEWNPSKSKQAIARAFRPGQDKVVYVYQLLATGTLEEEKYSRTTWKEWVSSMIFSEELIEDPSHWQAPKIEDELLREIVEEDRATLFHRIMKIEKASSVIRGKE